MTSIQKQLITWVLFPLLVLSSIGPSLSLVPIKNPIHQQQTTLLNVRSLAKTSCNGSQSSQSQKNQSNNGPCKLSSLSTWLSNYNYSNLLNKLALMFSIAFALLGLIFIGIPPIYKPFKPPKAHAAYAH